MMNLSFSTAETARSAAVREQREFPRVPICNLISYAAVHRGNRQSDYGMGRALDVSQAGIYLETLRRVKADVVSLMTADRQENLVEIKGRVAYCQKIEEGMYRTGIRFEGSHDENIGFDVYFVSSQDQVVSYLTTDSFEYYSQEECFAQNFQKYSGFCNQVDKNSGLLIVIPDELSRPMTKISVELTEKE